MQKDADQLHVAFNNRARKVFFALYNQFKQRITSLDRLRDENVFQQLQGQYVQTLKQQLESIAKELITSYNSSESSTLFSKSIVSTIADYATEFTQKVRSL